MKRLTEIKKLLKQVEMDNYCIMLQEKLAAFKKKQAARHALHFSTKQKRRTHIFPSI